MTKDTTKYALIVGLTRELVAHLRRGSTVDDNDDRAAGALEMLLVEYCTEHEPPGKVDSPEPPALESGAAQDVYAAAHGATHGAVLVPGTDRDGEQILPPLVADTSGNTLADLKGPAADLSGFVSTPLHTDEKPL